MDLRVSLFFLVMTMSCGKSYFTAGQPSTISREPTPPATPIKEDDVVQTRKPGPSKKRQLCSDAYSIPAKANPYLAGMPDGTSITYQNHSIDAVPAQAPVLVTPKSPDCLTAGASVYFDVSGTITHAGPNHESKPDGLTQREAADHQLGAHFGKSNVRAPLNSLLGVFLADGDPAASPPPAMLDFSRSEQRNQSMLSPLVGQIFFIGDGKTDQGVLQKIVVPAGATRLYLAVMDSYEWNNNTGEYRCAIETEVR